MSLLTIAQDAAVEIGLPTLSTVIGNSNENVKRLLAMANREGRELASKHAWTVLQREHTFTTTASTAEYSLPSDYTTILHDTAWDRTDFEEMRGNLSPQEWQVYKSGIIGSGIVHRRWRIKRAASGNTRKFVIDPTPTVTGDDLVFEYRSNGWCQSSGGTVQTEWAADDDTGILDEQLMTMGLVWRFLRSVGNEYGSHLLEYEQAVSRARADDLAMPSKTLHTASRLKLGGHVPDTGFGS